MNITYFIIQFILALAATMGFCVIFRVPVRDIPVCISIGAIGWIIYCLVTGYSMSPVVANFVASCAVGLMSDIASRIFKEASTVFIIPGILCLVPGAKIYQSMEEMLNSDTESAASTGVQTLLMAGAIAAGLLVIGAVIQVIRSITKKTVDKIGNGLPK